MTTAIKPIKERIKKLDGITLGSGGHSGPEAGMCVMEAVSWVYGKSWSDRPECACPVISAFLRRWNDDLNDDDRQMLKRYVLKLAGTKSTPEVEQKRAWMVTDWMVRTHLPAWLVLGGMSEQAEAVRALPEITKESVGAAMPTLNEARAKASAAWAAAWAAAWDAAGAAAWDAAGAAAGAAAVDAAGYAVWAAAWDAVRTAVRAAAWEALRPTVVSLQQSALELIDRLIEVAP